MLAYARRLSAILGWPLLALAGLAIGLWPAPGSLAAPTNRLFRIEASQFAYAPANLYSAANVQ